MTQTVCKLIHICFHIHTNILFFQIVRKVTAPCIPIATEMQEDYRRDIRDFGHLVSTMLKAYTVAKKQHLRLRSSCLQDVKSL